METLQSTIFIEFNVNTKKITFLRGDNIVDYDSNITNIYVRVKYKNLNGNTVYLTPSELEDYNFSLYTIKPMTNNIAVITGKVTDELKENVYGGVVKFEIPRVCTNRLGIVKCEIHINQGNKMMASSTFILDVRRSLVTEFNDALLEDEDFPVLKQLILEVQKANNIDDNNVSEITTYSSDKIENIREDLSSQIKEKVNRGEGGVITNAMLSQEVKESMTGGSVAVVGNNSILSDNIIDGQVKPRNTSFLKTGDNILPNIKDISNIGAQLNTSTGETYTAADYSVSNYIRVEPNKTYFKKLMSASGEWSTNWSFRIAYYNANYEIISGEDVGSLIETPDSCYFIRISSQSSDGVEFRNKYIGEVDVEWLLIGDYYDYEISSPKQKLSINNANLFDYTKYTKDTRFNSLMPGIAYTDSELLKASSNYFTSDYIECEEGEVLHLGWFDDGNFNYADAAQKSFMFFDKDKKIMGKSTITAPITVPKQAKYFRFYSNESRRLSFQVIKGSLPESATNQSYNKIPYIEDLRVAKYTEIKDWFGKKWLTYGDSITAIGNVENNSNHSWQYYVTDYHKFSSHIGRGIGGSTIKYKNTTWWANSDGSYNSRPNGNNTQPEGTTTHNASFCSFDRIKTMIDTSADLIFVMGGTNDFIQNVPIGDTEFSNSILTDTDWQNDTTYREFEGDFKIDTFKGAIASMIMKIQAYSPNSIIVLGTQLSGNGTTGVNRTDMVKNDLGLTPLDYANALKEVALEFSIPVIDVFSQTGINQLNRKNFIADTVHPYTTNGKKALARSVISGLKYILPNI